jgi:hypothetical protein
MDAIQEREAQITAGELQASHRVSAATPYPEPTPAEIAQDTKVILHAILAELISLCRIIERLVQK